MKYNLLIKTTILLILSLISIKLSAQTSIFFTSYLIRDDNTFSNRAGYQEWINNSTLHLGQGWSGETYQLHGYYSVDFLRFANNNKLDNYAHKFGLFGVRDYGDYTLNITAFARLHNYQEQYIYYKVNRYNLNLNVRFNPNLKNIYILGLTINKDLYKEFEDLNNLSYRFNGKYQHFFQSKMSITGEAGLGVKNYVNQTIVQYFGFGFARNRNARFREDPVRAAIFSFSAKLGKSITSNTGISASLGGQWFLGEPIASYSDGIYYYTENDLYDDPYSFSDKYVSIQFTRQFAVEFQGKIGIKYQKKNYKGTPALDEIGDLTDDTRKDSRQEYFFMITKKFYTGWKIPGSINIFMNFIYRKNPSNDPYYNFDDHIGLFGFSVGL